jgi:hypothetical protein
MNEMMKELKARAYKICQDQPEGITVSHIDTFAELIVRECIDIMQNCDGDIDFAIWKTKKDFGVKP